MGVHAGDFEAGLDAFLDLLRAAVVHIAHGPAYRRTVPVDQDQRLHLGTERDSLDVFFRDAGLLQEPAGSAAHGCPPLLRILFDAAVVQDIQIIVFHLPGDQPDAGLLRQFKETAL